MEDHSGVWHKCLKCRNRFETEMYVHYGTNEFNLTRLEDVPSYEPTRCANCGRTIRLAYDVHSKTREGYFCEDCFDSPR